MGKVYVFQGVNPSQLYFDSLVTTIAKGDEVAPRGKRIREIRPVVFKFQNPRNRVTFLKGRKINPFFQLAEALWILRGRADVKWLEKFNKNIAQFSDDGVYFNAPYGERLRFWGKNDASAYIYNPLDQLVDVYHKIKKDKETRQAVAIIYNPLFDNHTYGGKDTPCNIALTFKVRNEKLDLTVFNRSNDLHWGTMGANLCQFSTIQEVVASWLGLEVGDYHQITDSLHVYLDDYGAKETDKIFEAYQINREDLEQRGILPIREIKHFTFENEPRIKMGLEEFEDFMDAYFTGVDPLIQDDEVILAKSDMLLQIVSKAPDPYFRLTLLAMIAYRAHRLGIELKAPETAETVIKALELMPDSQWKLSCLYFLYKRYADNEAFNALFEHYTDEQKAYIRGE